MWESTFLSRVEGNVSRVEGIFSSVEGTLSRVPILLKILKGKLNYQIILMEVSKENVHSIAHRVYSIIDYPCLRRGRL